ncbi:hypothetical protein [Aquimarina megaterium]|uniref:hypothetical protein n=1 Tax=Aquimarina megaterium TaxID=1443666 RepID=UPI000471C472|nr:hypothetical protein [Aquimarina megaterium]
MREIDLNTLMLFITRTGMYIGKVSKESIISFIHGYEIGTEGKCKISGLISDLLFNEFGIKKMATGWNGQIEEYSKQRNQDWTISFRQLILKSFYRNENFVKDSEFNKHLKSRLESKIGQLNLEWVASDFQNWYDEWKGLVDLKEENFRIIWTEKELEVICDLDNEIDKIYNNKIQLTNKLLELRSKYENKTKTQQNV